MPCPALVHIRQVKKLTQKEFDGATSITSRELGESTRVKFRVADSFEYATLPEMWQTWCESRIAGDNEIWTIEIRDSINTDFYSGLTSEGDGSEEMQTNG